MKVSKKRLSFKHAEKELRERGLALAYGPTGSESGQPRWFVATEAGEVVCEGGSWVEAHEAALKRVTA